MSPASASKIADQLLHDLMPVDPAAADALGTEPENVMPALAPSDFAARHEAYVRAHRSLDALGTPMPAELVLGTALRERVDAQLALDEAGFTTAQLAPLVAAELGHDSIEAAAATLDADPARRLSTPDELIIWLQSRIDEVTNAVDGVDFDLPTVARRAECRISPTASGVMYYSPPDPSFSRPGRVWWAPPADGTSHTWREVTTVHHEGVPGHHLQITVAMTEPGLHPWQRSMTHVHGYVEGWAHYAERLADEFGLLRDPGERLGMLYGQRWRAARIVIDMGLHLGLPIPAGNGFTDATDWTPPVGVAMLREAAGVDETTARFEVDRYLGWPAQALAFRVGAQLWRQVRDAAERRPGFDLRAFHMHALRLGPLGLGPLREVMS